MPQLVKKRRLGWAVLAVGALIASLFAVGASPAAAIDDSSRADAATTMTACLGDAASGAANGQGFTDVAMGDTFESAINCLAYYGISKGTGDGSTFSPDATVHRWEMAVFLARAARLVGVDIGEEYDMGMMDDMDDGMDDMGAAMDDMDMMMEMSAAGFADLGGVASFIAHEIDAVAKAGIMSGDGHYFRPGDAMSRAEMAEALVALVGEASDQVSTDSRSGLYTAKGVTSYDEFADVRLSEPAHVSRAVSVAYELGITSGVGDGTMFDPGGDVTRGQMAAFITRALAHTSLRPAGITAQRDGDSIVASVRDANLAPVSNAVVDIFSADNANLSRAFKDDGSCGTAVQPSTGCQIDARDYATGADGDVSLARPTITSNGVTVWVWTGDIGDKFSSATDAFELELTEEATPAVGSGLKVTSDLAKHARFAHFGSTVNVTVQLVDADGTATGNDSSKWSVNAAISVHGGPNPGTTILNRQTITVKLDADGAGSFSLTMSDPDARKPNRNAVSFVLSGSGPGPDGDDLDLDGDSVTITGLREDEENQVPGCEALCGSVRFNDASPEVTAVEVDGGGYHTNPGAGTTVANTALVTIYDQYGDPVPGQPVRLSSNSSDELRPGDASTPARSRVTGRNGTVRIGYTHTGDADGHIEKLVAKVGMGKCDESGVTCGEVEVFWVADAQVDELRGKFLRADADRNSVVVDTNEADRWRGPTRVVYDSNDQFRIAGEPATIDKFEAELAKRGNADAWVGWSSYEPDDRSDVAVIKLFPSNPAAG